MSCSVRINSNNDHADDDADNTDEQHFVCVCHLAPFPATFAVGISVAYKSDESRGFRLRNYNDLDPNLDLSWSAVGLSID